MAVKNIFPKVERLHGGRPVLKPVSAHPWENKVTFNPACAFVEKSAGLSGIIRRLPFPEATKNKLRRERGLCFLLYRAQGEETPGFDYRRSAVGLAILSPRLKLLARHADPVIYPDQDYDNLGVEDGRITKIGNRYVMVYTAYSPAAPENKIRIALASTRDFVHWEKHGLLKGDFNTINNKNGMIFEKKVGKRYIMLHRPMEGEHAMTVHWAEADDVFGEWKSRGVLMDPLPDPAFKDIWTGGGAPPLSIGGKKFLLLYHIGKRKWNGEREYDLGMAIADFGSDKIIIRRHEPLMRPATKAETVPVAELGLANVLFVCGAYFHKRDFYFPYAGADSVVLGGKISGRELQQYCRS